MTFVLAGTKEQYDEWLMKRSDRSKYRYLSNIGAFRGATGSDVVGIGTYKERRDYLEVLRFLEMRGMSIKEEPK